MKNRLKEIRKYFNLTQTELADKLGLKQNTIATYEMGKGELNNTSILLLCKIYNINETWLRYGIGDMLVCNTEPYTEIETLIDKYHLSDKEVTILRNYLDMTEDKRKIFVDLIFELARKADSKDNDTPQIIAASSSETEY